MSTARIRFDGCLNDFLPPEKRNRPLDCDFNENPSVKHLIEALGVPHPEVGQILVQGSQVGFGYHVEDGDQIEVLPLEDPLPAEPCFLLDNHLGQLAVYLRVLGFDTWYRNDYQDDELAAIVAQQDRILLTRDRGLLKRSVVRYGYWVRSRIPRQQAVEVIRHFKLASQITPFRRCLRCNAILRPVEKQAILHRLEPLTKLYFDEFHLCSHCDQVYWKGSHYDHMQALIQQLLEEGQRETSN